MSLDNPPHLRLWLDVPQDLLSTRQVSCTSRTTSVHLPGVSSRMRHTACTNRQSSRGARRCSSNARPSTTNRSNLGLPCLQWGIVVAAVETQWLSTWFSFQVLVRYSREAGAWYFDVRGTPSRKDLWRRSFTSCQLITVCIPKQARETPRNAMKDPPKV